MEFFILVAIASIYCILRGADVCYRTCPNPLPLKKMLYTHFCRDFGCTVHSHTWCWRSLDGQGCSSWSRMTSGQIYHSGTRRCCYLCANGYVVVARLTMKTCNKYVYIKKYHSDVPSSELRLSQPLSRQWVCPSPQKRGEATLSCGWGVGGVPIPTTGEKA